MTVKKVILYQLFTFITVAFLLSACGQKARLDSKTNAAYVNGLPISRHELSMEMSRLQQRFYSNKMSKEQLKEMKKQVLAILIGGRILYQAGTKSGIEASPAEIKSELAKVKLQYPGSKTFKNNFTKAEMRRKVVVEKFIRQEFADKTIVTNEESRQYYHSHLADFTRPALVKISQILIKTDKNEPRDKRQAALKKITAVQKKLQHGDDFAKLARKYSEAPSKDKGGNMGFLMQGQMPKTFEDVAFKLKTGAVSAIVSTDSGYHILMVTDKKPAYVTPYADIEKKLKGYLKQRDIQRKLGAFIKQRREKAKIKIFI
ncbi:MAG TPA: hypothetical protein ENJ28_08180 [Gammaproteobacteria bacterium]|nr:hypothetical protein [Gammaproteobacteria bacterium]